MTRMHSMINQRQSLHALATRPPGHEREHVAVHEHVQGNWSRGAGLDAHSPRSQFDDCVCANAKGCGRGR